MEIARDWKDYEILDMSDGEKLERWNNIVLIRPDPQIIWKEKMFPEKWKLANARYNRSSNGGGGWKYNKKVPDSWKVQYKELTFNIKLMGFKHTGLFPEQAVNWDWMINKIRNSGRKDIKVLEAFESAKVYLKEAYAKGMEIGGLGRAEELMFRFPRLFKFLYKIKGQLH